MPINLICRKYTALAGSHKYLLPPPSQPLTTTNNLPSYLCWVLLSCTALRCTRQNLPIHHAPSASHCLPISVSHAEKLAIVCLCLRHPSTPLVMNGNQCSLEMMLINIPSRRGILKLQSFLPLTPSPPDRWTPANYFTSQR